jgi:hypothetical protein
VVHGGEEECGAENELAKDLLSVVHFFVARNNGRRSAGNRKNDNYGMCTKKDAVTRPMKPKLDTTQQITLSRWCGVYRWTYNECVRLRRTNAVTYLGKVKTTRELRSHVANGTCPVMIERPWMFQVSFRRPGWRDHRVRQESQGRDR